LGDSFPIESHAALLQQPVNGEVHLDDEIRDLTPSAVPWVVALISHFQAAAFDTSYYPDNSMACHGYRLIGDKQRIFPGGSALVVDVERCDTLFPTIYNGDWLFLFTAAQKRSFTVAGVLSQLEHQPFGHSARAASEESDDLIAERLYRLIHEGANVSDAATSAYRLSVLERRFQLIETIAARLVRRDGSVVGFALMSLAAARNRLTTISPLACVSFTHAWQTDLDAWRQALHSVPTAGDLADTAKFLELPISDRGLNQ